MPPEGVYYRHSGSFGALGIPLILATGLPGAAVLSVVYGYAIVENLLLDGDVYQSILGLEQRIADRGAEAEEEEQGEDEEDEKDIEVDDDE